MWLLFDRIVPSKDKNGPLRTVAFLVGVKRLAGAIKIWIPFISFATRVRFFCAVLRFC